MKEILGFIVLSSPLFLIVLWLPVCIGLGIWVGRKLLRKRKLAVRLVAGMLIFLFAMVAPLADEIAGRIYLAHLCETEAGAKVYQSIKLPSEYWDEKGNPNFYDARNTNFTLPLERFADPVYEEKLYFLNILRTRSLLLDKDSGNILGKRVRFGYRHGWLLRNFSPHNSSVSCDDNDNIVSNYTKYVNKQYEPIKEVSNGYNK